MPQYSQQSDHPVPCVDAIVQNEEGKILLVHRTVPPCQGMWGIVGGRVEVSDNNTEAAVMREVREETGLEVEVTHLVDIVANPKQKPPADTRFYIVQIVYLARPVGGELRISDEADRFRWVGIKEALKEELTFNHRHLLEIYHKKQTQLISAKRSYYTEYFDKEYTYVIQNDYPRFAANAIILNDQAEVLLARRAQPYYVGHWDFPGGHMYVNETVAECLEREMYEELGVRGKIGKLFGVYSDKGRHIKAASISGIYFATIESQRFLRNVEMDDFRYFPLDQLPDKLAYHNDIPLQDVRSYLAAGGRPYG